MQMVIDKDTQLEEMSHMLSTHQDRDNNRVHTLSIVKDALRRITQEVTELR